MLYYFTKYILTLDTDRFLNQSLFQSLIPSLVQFIIKGLGRRLEPSDSLSPWTMHCHLPHPGDARFAILYDTLYENLNKFSC